MSVSDDWQMAIEQAKTTGELADLVAQVHAARDHVDRIYHDPPEDEALHWLWLRWQMHRSRS
jgi:hypothetical protein